MAIKINSLSSGGLQGLGSSGPIERSERTPSSSSSESARRSDSVSLTSIGAQLQQLENRIAQMPVVDARLVEEVQRQLATGSFVLDPESSADKLIIMEKSLP